MCPTHRLYGKFRDVNRGRPVAPPKLGSRFHARLIMLEERQELSCEADMDGLYWIVSGALQTSIISEDGRRWIGGFHLPGEVILLERGQVSSQFAEALCPTSVVVTEKKVLAELQGFDDLTCETVWRWFLQTYASALRRGFLLARSNAVEKLAFFLTDLADRLEGRSTLHLLMSRTEIGDHLGLTNETVTRTFTSLQNRHYLRVHGREVEIINLPGLRKLAEPVIST